MKDFDDDYPVCANPEDGELVFVPRSTLTEEEKERADFHIGSCFACQTDMDYDHFFNRLMEATWATYTGK